MIMTLNGEPGDNDRNAEVARGISEMEELLRLDAERLKTQEDKGIVTFIDSGFHWNLGHLVNTGHILPSRDFREVYPGVYGFN